MTARSRKQVMGAKLPRLFDPPPADEQTLTERQTLALRILRAHPAGLTAYELGRAVHDETQPTHSARCAYCGGAGGELAKALKARGLVVQRARGVYQAVVQPEPALAVQPITGDDGSFEAFIRGAGQ